MEKLDLVIITVHVLAVVVWVGSLVGVGLVATAKGDAGIDSKIRGALARRIYQRASVPAFVVAFGAGLFRLLRGWNEGYPTQFGTWSNAYAKSPWMHAKLTMALVIIALHHIVGARTRKMANNGATEGPIAVMTWIITACAAAVVFFVIVRPFHS
jgi:protoporphyrinogen IX oxidase